jgi:16S rRNA G966 N2-methylase RsmD
MEEILNLLKKEYTLQKSIDSVKNIIEPVFFNLTLRSIIEKFDNTSKEYRTDWSKLLFDVKKSKGVLSTLIKGLYGTYGGNLESIVNLNTDEYAPKDVTMVFANTPNKKEQKELVKVFQESLGPQYNVILINGDKTSNRKVQKEAKEAIFIAKREGKKVVFISRDMGSRSFSVPEIDTVILMFDRGSYATVTQKISRVLTPGKTYHNQEKKYGYIISLSLDPNRDEVSPIDEYIVYESERVNVNELSDGIKRVLRSINIFTNDSGELTTLELDQYSEKLISSSTLIKIGKASSNPDSILLDTNLVDFLTGIKIDNIVKQKVEKLEGINSAEVGRFLEENTSGKEIIKKDDEVKKIISVREKIRQHIENMFDNICEISEINNCESNNIFECLQMIKNKGYESEVIFEVGIDCEKVKKIIELGGISEKLLNTIITSYNKNPELNKWKQNQNNGEVFTPSRLVRRMLDRIPEKVWKNPKLTFCDLSMGTGSFLVEIVNRLVNIYKYTEEDAKSRVFGYDIHVKYVNYLKRMGYKNLFCTDSLKENFKMRFDVVLGNPPYQKQVGPKKTEAIWPKFVDKSFEICKEGGYVSLIHPSGWRNVDGNYKNIQNLLKSKNIINLDIYDDSDGLKIFNAAIKFDVYLIENVNGLKSTKIKDQNDNMFNIDLTNFNFIPNGMFSEILSLVAKDDEPTVEILHSYSDYETRKPYMSKVMTEKHIYPCVSNVTKSEDTKLLYSNINTNGHFGVPKLICGSASSGTNYFIDVNGDYGITQFSFGIIDEPMNLNLIKKVMKSEIFQKIIKSIPNNSNAVNYKVLKTFKKDFWKYFLDEDNNVIEPNFENVERV